MYLEDLIILQHDLSVVSQDVQKIILSWWALVVPWWLWGMGVETCELVASSLDAELLIAENEKIYIIDDACPAWLQIIDTDLIAGHSKQKGFGISFFSKWKLVCGEGSKNPVIYCRADDKDILSIVNELMEACFLLERERVKLLNRANFSIQVFQGRKQTVRKFVFGIGSIEQDAWLGEKFGACSDFVVDLITLDPVLQGFDILLLFFEAQAQLQAHVGLTDRHVYLFIELRLKRL